MLQRRCCNEQVGAIVPTDRRQLPPTARSGGINEQDSVVVPGQHPIQPNGQLTGESRVVSTLLSDAFFDFSDGYNAQVEVRCPLRFHPTHYTGIPFAPTEGRNHVCVKEKRHRSCGLLGRDRRSNSRSSCGISNSSSPRVGALDFSKRRSRAYSSAASTTTAGCPRRVTC